MRNYEKRLKEYNKARSDFNSGNAQIRVSNDFYIGAINGVLISLCFLGIVYFIIKIIF